MSRYNGDDQLSQNSGLTTPNKDERATTSNLSLDTAIHTSNRTSYRTKMIPMEVFSPSIFPSTQESPYPSDLPASLSSTSLASHPSFPRSNSSFLSQVPRLITSPSKGSLGHSSYESSGAGIDYDHNLALGTISDESEPEHISPFLHSRGPIVPLTPTESSSHYHNANMEWKQKYEELCKLVIIQQQQLAQRDAPTGSVVHDDEPSCIGQSAITLLTSSVQASSLTTSQAELLQTPISSPELSEISIAVKSALSQLTSGRPTSSSSVPAESVSPQIHNAHDQSSTIQQEQIRSEPAADKPPASAGSVPPPLPDSIISQHHRRFQQQLYIKSRHQVPAYQFLSYNPRLYAPPPLSLLIPPHSDSPLSRHFFYKNVSIHVAQRQYLIDLFLKSQQFSALCQHLGTLLSSWSDQMLDTYSGDYITSMLTNNKALYVFDQLSKEQQVEERQYLGHLDGLVGPQPTSPDGFGSKSAPSPVVSPDPSLTSPPSGQQTKSSVNAISQHPDIKMLREHLHVLYPALQSSNQVDGTNATAATSTTTKTASKAQPSSSTQHDITTTHDLFLLGNNFSLDTTIQSFSSCLTNLSTFFLDVHKLSSETLCVGIVQETENEIMTIVNVYNNYVNALKSYEEYLDGFNDRYDKWLKKSSNNQMRTKLAQEQQNRRYVNYMRFFKHMSELNPTIQPSTTTIPSEEQVPFSIAESFDEEVLLYLTAHYHNHKTSVHSTNASQNGDHAPEHSTHDPSMYTPTPTWSIGSSQTAQSVHTPKASTSTAAAATAVALASLKSSSYHANSYDPINSHGTATTGASSTRVTTHHQPSDPNYEMEIVSVSSGGIVKMKMIPKQPPPLPHSPVASASSSLAIHNTSPRHASFQSQDPLPPSVSTYDLQNPKFDIQKVGDTAGIDDSGSVSTPTSQHRRTLSLSSSSFSPFATGQGYTLHCEETDTNSDTPTTSPMASQQFGASVNGNMNGMLPSQHSNNNSPSIDHTGVSPTGCVDVSQPHKEPLSFIITDTPDVPQHQQHLATLPHYQQPFLNTQLIIQCPNAQTIHNKSSRGEESQISRSASAAPTATTGFASPSHSISQHTSANSSSVQHSGAYQPYMSTPPPPAKSTTASVASAASSSTMVPTCPSTFTLQLHHQHPLFLSHADDFFHFSHPKLHIPPRTQPPHQVGQNIQATYNATPPPAPSYEKPIYLYQEDLNTYYIDFCLTPTIPTIPPHYSPIQQLLLLHIHFEHCRSLLIMYLNYLAVPSRLQIISNISMFLSQLGQAITPRLTSGIHPFDRFLSEYRVRLGELYHGYSCYQETIFNYTNLAYQSLFNQPMTLDSVLTIVNNARVSTTNQHVTGKKESSVGLPSLHDVLPEQDQLATVYAAQSEGNHPPNGVNNTNNDDDDDGDDTSSSKQLQSAYSIYPKKFDQEYLRYLTDESIPIRSNISMLLDAGPTTLNIHDDDDDHDNDNTNNPQLGRNPSEHVTLHERTQINSGDGDDDATKIPSHLIRSTSTFRESTSTLGELHRLSSSSALGISPSFFSHPVSLHTHNQTSLSSSHAYMSSLYVWMVSTFPFLKHITVRDLHYHINVILAQFPSNKPLTPTTVLPYLDQYITNRAISAYRYQLQRSSSFPFTPKSLFNITQIPSDHQLFTAEKILYSGYMLKRATNITRDWQRRFFILSPNYFYYYRDCTCYKTLPLSIIPQTSQHSGSLQDLVSTPTPSNHSVSTFLSNLIDPSSLQPIDQDPKINITYSDTVSRIQHYRIQQYERHQQLHSSFQMPSTPHHGPTNTPGGTASARRTFGGLRRSIGGVAPPPPPSPDTGKPKAGVQSSNKSLGSKDKTQDMLSSYLPQNTCKCNIGVRIFSVLHVQVRKAAMTSTKGRVQQVGLEVTTLGQNNTRKTSLLQCYSEYGRDQWVDAIEQAISNAISRVQPTSVSHSKPPAFGQGQVNHVLDSALGGDATPLDINHASPKSMPTMMLPPPIPTPSGRVPPPPPPPRSGYVSPTDTKGSLQVTSEPETSRANNGTGLLLKPSTFPFISPVHHPPENIPSTMSLYSFTMANPNSTQVLCADCGGSDTPIWCSINFGIFLCKKCVGIHRSFGVQISKTRSPEHDNLDPPQLYLLQHVGNALSNKIYEGHILPGFRKPTHNTNDDDRLEFITNKYVRKAFVSRTILSKYAGIATDTLYELFYAVCSGDIYQIMCLMASGGSVNGSFTCPVYICRFTPPSNEHEHSRIVLKMDIDDTDDVLIEKGSMTTLVHVSALQGDALVLEFLINNVTGAKVQLDGNGDTPFVLATKTGNSYAAQRLTTR